MKTLSRSLKYAAVATTLSLGAFGVTPAQAAGFSGYFNPSNFTLTNTNSNGSVNPSSAPNSIDLIGTDGVIGGGGAGTLDYTIAAGAGAFSFDWSYTTADGPEYDPFFVLINGVATQLTSNSVLSGTESGIFTTTVNEGDIIGWRVASTDNTTGAPTVTISNFSATAAVPEPFTIIGTCIGGAAALRMRRKLKSKV